MQLTNRRNPIRKTHIVVSSSAMQFIIAHPKGHQGRLLRKGNLLLAACSQATLPRLKLKY